MFAAEFDWISSKKGRTGPEETGVRALGGRGCGAAAAQGHSGGALQETGPQECAQEETGRGETPSPEIEWAGRLGGVQGLVYVSGY